MRELTVTLETVTPLFLAGACPRGEPELRPPAFRGALRYWLRAALGGVYGGSSEGLRRVRETEAAVFGSTDDGLGGASAVTVRVAGASFVPQLFARAKAPTGRDYLYWSMDRSGSQERGNYQPPKQFLPVGCSFSLTLATRPGVARPEQALRRAAAALWLLVNIGGVGSRARRTAGSLAAKEGTELAGLALRMPAANVMEASAELGHTLSHIRSEYLPRGDARCDGTAEFDVLHPAVCRIWVLGLWPSPESAVDAMGIALRDFRAYREPDHRNVARWLQGEEIPAVERAAFGLPIPYRYSEGGPSATIQGSSTDRRASPLWLTVSKIGSGQCVGVATLFKSRFLPQGEKLRAARARAATPRVEPPSDYSLVERWIPAAFPVSQEVSYA